LDELYDECRLPDWEGGGEDAIDIKTHVEAVRFLLKLPSWVEVPEVEPEPKGNISFEWHVRRGWTFVVAITKLGTLEYAGVFGNGLAYGSEALADSIPKSVLDNLKRLYA